MNKNKAFEIFFALLCIAGMIGCLPVAGCSQYVVTETYTSEAVTYTSEAKQNLFLYYTSTKPFELITPYSSFIAGGMEARPDPNSIAAVSEATGNVIKKLLIP